MNISLFGKDKNQILQVFVSCIVFKEIILKKSNCAVYCDQEDLPNILSVIIMWVHGDQTTRLLKIILLVHRKMLAL